MDALPNGARAGGLVLVFLTALGIMTLARDGPAAIFRKQVERMARGESEELNLPALSRAYRKIGEDLHKAIDTIVEKGGGKRGMQRANLDEILGPTPEPLTSSAFSFGAAVDEASKAAPLPAPGQPAPMLAPGALKPPPPAPLKPPPPVPALPGRSNAAPAPLAPPPVASASPGGSDEDHYREVFEQYLTTRKQCGESIAELTFDKFCITLRKNRDQILGSRPDARGVRFTVYVKDGKAALKASPTKA
jgi:hypothetical protein